MKGIGALRSKRRPADVLLARGPEGVRTALDFAVVSGFAQVNIALAESNPTQVVIKKEEEKRSFVATGDTESTEALCKANKIDFRPMVIEAHSGAWSRSARQVLDYIARNIACRTGESVDLCNLRLAQRLSISLHRDNARAILKRRGEAALIEEPEMGV